MPSDTPELEKQAGQKIRSRARGSWLLPVCAVTGTLALASASVALWVIDARLDANAERAQEASTAQTRLLKEANVGARMIIERLDENNRQLARQTEVLEVGQARATGAHVQLDVHLPERLGVEPRPGHRPDRKGKAWRRASTPIAFYMHSQWNGDSDVVIDVQGEGGLCFLDGRHRDCQDAVSIPVSLHDYDQREVESLGVRFKQRDDACPRTVSLQYQVTVDGVIRAQGAVEYAPIDTGTSGYCGYHRL